MERDSITQIILNAPAWALIGLTMRDERMRERAADTLAATIVDKLSSQDNQPDPNQMALPL